MRHRPHGLIDMRRAIGLPREVVVQTAASATDRERALCGLRLTELTPEQNCVLWDAQGRGVLAEAVWDPVVCRIWALGVDMHVPRGTGVRAAARALTAALRALQSEETE